MGGGRATLRLTITRGMGARGLNYPELIEPTVLMTIFPSSMDPLPFAKITISSIKRNEHSPLANIKSLAYLENVLARREAVKLGFDEAIVLNLEGNIAEASAANIFIVTKDNAIITPPLTEGILPGVTRDIVLTLATKKNIAIEERAIHPDELFTAKEIFLTNSVIEIQGIKQLQDRFFSADHPITSLLQASYKTTVTHFLSIK